MAIHVTLAHADHAGGLYINPGVYDEDDPRLHGLADYLVRTGHAVRQPDTTANAPLAPEPVEAVELDGLTKTELLDLAALWGVEVSARMTKAEILEALS